MIRKDVDVVQRLLEHRGQDINIVGIAKALKLDYKSAHNIIMRLEKRGIVTLETFGRSSKIILNAVCNPLIYEAEYQRQQAILNNNDLKTMLDYFKRGMPTQFYILLLFGSYANKTNTKQSDIDLFLIVSDSSFETSIQQIAGTIPLKLHLNIYTEKEFTAMKKSKEMTVGSEAMRNNIILCGIEPYYALIQ